VINSAVQGRLLNELIDSDLAAIEVELEPELIEGGGAGSCPAKASLNSSKQHRGPDEWLPPTGQ